MNNYIFWILFLFSTAVCSQSSVTLNIDKEWGLHLGDEVHIRADVTDMTSKIDGSSLPDIHERYGNWLSLQGIDIVENNIDFHWQVVNVPAKNKRIHSPEFNIRLKDDSWIHIPSQSLIIGPALAIDNAQGTDNLHPKPDHKPLFLPTQAVKTRLLIFSLLTLFTGAILLIWYIGWHPTQRSPFAQALHDYRIMSWMGKQDPEQFIRILHTAFNRTAGTVIVPEHLEKLFEQAPWLTPLENEIRHFYQQSAQHFFSRDKVDKPDYKIIKKLTKACRAKEKLI